MAHVGRATLPAARAGALAVRGRVLPLGVGRPTPAALHASDARYDLVLAQRAPLQTLKWVGVGVGGVGGGGTGIERTDQSDCSMRDAFLSCYLR